MVYGPGGYSFKDYFKYGFPLTVLFMITTLVMLNWLYLQSKNKLFTIQHGYWVVRNNWRRQQLQLVDVNSKNIPNKVYKLYYDLYLQV